MEFHVITIFPNMVEDVVKQSIIGRAQKSGVIKVFTHDLRKWTDDNHKTVDDRPFGGGPGMVMMVAPLYKAIKEVKSKIKGRNIKVLLTSAKGKQFKQERAKLYKELDALIIICGHYEGVDERVAKYLVDEEISVGPYVLTGGELPALIILDAVARLVPGSLGNEESLGDESYEEEGIGEAPQYTRPAEFISEEGESWKVPAVLLSGNHKEIESWRQENKVKLDTD